MYAVYAYSRTLGYYCSVEVTITRFRRELFELVNLAMKGEVVCVLHKGARFRIVPELQPNRFSRLTPMQIVVPGADLDDLAMKREMAEAWEKDWSDL